MSRDNRAFTLMEMAIVLVVIGILTAILIPVFSNVIVKSNAKSALSDARHTAEQYVMNTFTNKNAQETMVIVVYKGGAYWLFGYDRDASHNGNKLMISKQNPYSENEFMKNDSANSIMDNWSFNSKWPGQMPDTSGATVYDADEDGTFWLVPYYDNGAKVYDVRTVPSYDDEKYMLLNTSAASTVGENDLNASYVADGEEFGSDGDIAAYHGLLLPGTFTIDDEEVNTTGTDGTDYSATTYTLSFLLGDVPFDATSQGTTAPASVTIAAGATVYPSAYTITNPHEDYTYHWDRTSAFIMKKNVTLTAVWTEKPVYTVTFDCGTGNSFDTTTKTAARSAMEAAGFTWAESGNTITLSSGSKKLHAGQNIDIMLAMQGVDETNGGTFTGWQSSGSIYNSVTTIPVTGNMTFTAVYSSDTVHVTVNPNNGHSEEVIEQDVASGSYISLPAVSGLTTPSGKVFGYWSWTLSGTQFGDGASVQVSADVTFTAHWVNDELTVQYATDIPAKASTAGLSATVPATSTYSSSDRPAGEQITIGGASLAWYSVTSYTIVYPGGAQTLTPGVDTMVFSTSGISSGTILITPNYAAMTVTIQYRNGGYNIDGWDTLVPAAATYDLIDIRAGYTICTNDLTCNEGYKFEGWLDSADMNANHIYAPSATYTVTESLNGKTVIFMAYFNEEELVNVRSIVFNFYDSQNYPAAEKASHILYTYTSNVTVGMTITANLMAANMPSSSEYSVTVTSATGSTYNGELYFDYAASLKGAFTNYQVTSETANDYVIWVPSLITITINGEPYFVITTTQGFKNIDQGTVTVNGSPVSPSMGYNYALANDIVLSGNTAPLGFQGNTNPSYMWTFEGLFNGLGYTISGFHFNPSQNNDFVGLFSNTSSGSVLENFRLSVDGTIRGYTYTGAVTGENCGTIRNVVVDLSTSNAVSGWVIAGGVCGRNEGTIDNCHVITTVASTRTIMARGAQCNDSSNDEYESFSYNSQTYKLRGSFIGGIAGTNDGGTITKCSVCGNGVLLGLHPDRVGAYTDSSYTDRAYNCGYIGGIAGANVTGMIDQCWTANIDLCKEYYTDSNGYFNHNISGLTCIGGIVGANELAANLQHCWSMGVNMTAYDVAGGIAGMHNRWSSMTDCWVKWSGVIFAGSAANVGDLVSTSCTGATATISNCVIWNCINTGYAPAAAQQVSNLSNVSPATYGLSDCFYQHANGPMLTANPYAVSWTI